MHKMIEWMRRLWLFGEREDFTAERWTEYQEAKQKALEKILGPLDNYVWHAIIPFEVGGAVDMYPFSSHIPGTVFTTMELIKPNGKGPKPNRMGTYELVSCTRLENPAIDFSNLRESIRIKEAGPLDLSKAFESMGIKHGGPFEQQQQRLCGMLTALGHYSFKVVLQPGETGEIPGDKEDDTKYILFDEFDSKGIPFEVEGRRHGLLLCIEIYYSEVKYAQTQGGERLIEKLKEAGIYPYSDLDRKAVA